MWLSIEHDPDLSTAVCMPETKLHALSVMNGRELFLARWLYPQNLLKDQIYLIKAQIALV